MSNGKPLVSVELIGDKELKKDLKRMNTQMELELRREIKRTCEGIWNHYYRDIKSHSKTGKTEKLIVKDTKDNWKSGEVGAIKSDPPVPLFLELGTKAHVIKIRSKKVLACKSEHYNDIANPYGSGQLPMYSKDGSYVIFGPVVDHPGTKANNYLLKAWLKWIVPDRFAERLKRRFDRIK